MTSYLIRRALLIIPTLLGIMTLNFIIIQFAPGGPVENTIAKLQGIDVGATERVSGGTKDNLTIQDNMTINSSKYVGAQGLDPEIIAEIEKMYGFDKPAHIRFINMIKNYLTFDFGSSFFQDKKVIDLIKEKLPVSISLGLWTTFLVYLISIPLGIYKAVNDGRKFDIWSSIIVVVGNAIPSFLFALLLIILFSGGKYFDIFPLRGIVSDNWNELNNIEKIIDYLWHLVLPITALVIGSFASLTMLTKNSFLDQINQQYVLTARAKGNTENKILYGHVFRNAMLIVIAGFPTAFIGILFTGALLIEIIFSLDGLGLLGFEAAINRDYPVMFASLYIFTLLGLIMNIMGDLTMTIVDPRIDFEKR
ncbi:MAG: microcin ABC transporter permease [Pelagibacterales bacterium]|nr:microcin ABC transporter permease [Pelagibacterales bacterium]|tara:strand:+ start:1415 stop:2506 length:1092 start_codon:yes stop_codon:yes gene_type:complete